MVALTLIAKDAAHYGIQADPEPPVATDVVKPGRAIDLRLVAETIDVDVETLRSLNPSLLRLATPEDPSFELRLPQGTAEKFSAEIADIPPDKWVSWRRHRVEAGETLTSIAKKYRVTRGDTLEGIADRFSISPEDVRKWNRLKSNRVGRGMVLRIYTIGSMPETSPMHARSRSKKKTSAPAAGSNPGPVSAANHN